MKAFGYLVLAALTLSAGLCTHVRAGNVIKVKGTRFYLNDKPFEFTGITFFNALYNPEFNKSAEARKAYLRRFKGLGINVIRIWCQWDNDRGFIDAGKDSTLYAKDGSLRPNVLSTIQALAKDADEEDFVILLVLFSRESWNEGIRLTDKAMDRAVADVARQLKPYRNVIFQVWNEFDHRVIESYTKIKAIDKARLVTNSPGYAGIPLDGFSDYHDQVFNFLKNKDRYLKDLR